MSNGKNPLMMMMALSMPGAAHALGLGDIHVDSRLNERLTAEIDIIGATPAELAELKVAVANRDTFLRYGVDRPAFLSSATFKVTRDNQGRPVLAVRSAESFTEPVVNFLVDLRWHNSEMVREYTLLLDPTGFSSVPPVPAAPAATVMPAVAVTQSVAAPAEPVAAAAQQVPPSTRKTTHVKVGAKATLHGVAWRVGARSETDLQKTMIAIFRANPGAFDGNINKLHLGAMLTIPSKTEIASIANADAKREVRAQMAAWRSTARAPVMAERAATAAPTATHASSVAAVSAATVPAATAEMLPEVTVSSESEALGHRVQSLEQELSAMKSVLDSERRQLAELHQQAALADTSTAAVGPAPTVETENGPIRREYSSFAPIVGGVGVLAAALAGLYLKLRRRPASPKASTPAAGADDGNNPMTEAQADAIIGASRVSQPQPMPVPAGLQSSLEDTVEAEIIAAATHSEATHPMLPVMNAVDPARQQANMADTILTPAAPEATVKLRMDPTRLDFNLLDLDLTAQHVQMPSVLNEHAVVKERRTNLADVLRMAIEREPDRHDLRMKLLELYYSAAATNRQAFMEVAQKFTRDHDYLNAEQWDKIAQMGRQLAGDSAMFAEESADDDDLANCA